MFRWKLIYTIREPVYIRTLSTYHNSSFLLSPMSNFTSFKQSFKGDISIPGDADYTQAIRRWALNAQVNAKIVAFVKIPEDVALAIAYAKDNRLPIAIRGGGHSTGGASSTEGLVIDLSRHLNTVKIDAENKLAYVGGGAIWEQVDNASIQHGLATVAGTVNDVCVTLRS
jgi:FAD/FMN-containing dehydrogenase